MVLGFLNNWYQRSEQLDSIELLLNDLPAGTRRPGTSPESPLKVLMSGTSRGPPGDSQGTNKKIDNLMKKVFFRCNSSCFTRLLLFLLEKQIWKSSKWGRPWDVYGTQLRDIPETRWRDVLGTSMGRRSYMFFKFNSETYLTYFNRLLETL